MVWHLFILFAKVTLTYDHGRVRYGFAGHGLDHGDYSH